MGRGRNTGLIGSPSGDRNGPRPKYHEIYTGSEINATCSSLYAAASNVTFRLDRPKQYLRNCREKSSLMTMASKYLRGFWNQKPTCQGDSMYCQMTASIESGPGPKSK